MKTCCTEHARASAGLPAIEAGMPVPAGAARRIFGAEVDERFSGNVIWPLHHDIPACARFR